MRKDLTIYGLVILIGFMMGMYTCKTCGKENECPPSPEPKDVKVSDSTRWYTPQIAFIEGGHIPDTVRVPYPVKTPPLVRIDSFIEYAYHKVDTAAILKDYFARVYYRDSVPTQYGFIEILDTVSENRIQKRKVLANLTIPVQERLVPQKKRNSVWWGASGYWIDSTAGLSTSLMFIHKKGWAIEAETGIDIRGNRKHEAGVKFNLGKK